MTYEQKATVLRSYGFTVGPRDPRLNTNHSGTWMVVEGSIAEIESDYDLPTQDGANGPWCVVGDDLSALVDEAFDFASCFDRFDDVCADVLAGGDGVLRS